MMCSSLCENITVRLHFSQTIIFQITGTVDSKPYLHWRNLSRAFRCCFNFFMLYSFLLPNLFSSPDTINFFLALRPRKSQSTVYTICIVVNHLDKALVTSLLLLRGSFLFFVTLNILFRSLNAARSSCKVVGTK